MEITRKNKIIFVLGFIILALLFSIDLNDVAYINASTISSSGLVVTSGNDTQLISEMNMGYWAGNESAGLPFSINITYYNVTGFDYVDLTSRYFSASATPSTHEVELMIWCEIHQEFMELKDYHNENHWYTRQYGVIDSSHFIMPNGTVIIQMLHESNGNSNHVMWIDVARLVVRT